MPPEPTSISLVAVLAVLAAITGPIAAVLISLWLQGRKEKRDMMRQVFYTLMAHRQSTPIPQEWVNALNLIDVAFHDHPQVVRLWHEYFAMLSNWNNTSDQDRVHKYLDLLEEMAKELGYKNIRQTSIDKFYSPQAFGDRVGTDARLRSELLRVLENTEILTLPSRGATDDEQEPRQIP